MINKLSVEQKEQFKAYKDKYISIGLCVAPVSYADAKEIADYYYTNIKKDENRKPVKIIICKNPLIALRAIFYYKFLLKKIKNKEQEVWREVRQEVRQEVEQEGGGGGGEGGEEGGK